MFRRLVTYTSALSHILCFNSLINNSVVPLTYFHIYEFQTQMDETQLKLIIDETMNGEDNPESSTAPRSHITQWKGTLVPMNGWFIPLT